MGIRLRVLTAVVGSVSTIACSSATSSPSSPSTDAGACGLTFYTGNYDKTCQQALDKACCAQEQACANDADCVKLIACVNACPAPKSAQCVTACTGDGGTPPGFPHVDAIATCTMQPPYVQPTADSCDWPSGQGH